MPPRARPAFSLHPANLAFGALTLFILGMFTAGAGWRFDIVLAAALIACTATIVVRERLWRECCLFAAALLAGAFYYHAFFVVRDLRTSLPIGRQASFSAIVTDEPAPTQYGSIMLTVRVLAPLRGKLVLFAPTNMFAEGLAYGDLVNVTGTIEAPKRTGELPGISGPQVERIASGGGFFLRGWMIRLKEAALKKFREALPYDEAALLGGISFGSRAAFTPELASAMSLSGTTHLVAVSGYNITIVVVAAGAVFGRFFGRRAAFAAAVALIALFIFMVGAQASALRAAIMGFVGLVGREAGEAVSMRNLIVFTAAAMALADPSVLVEDVGFILSFASLLGIVYLGPPVRRFFRCGDSGAAPLFGFRESAATTISAQLAVMPVLIRTFGQFSLTAVFANVLILATVPLVMFLGAALAVLVFVSRLLAFFTAQFAGLLLGYELFVIRSFAALAVPFPISFDSGALATFYYILLAIIVFSHKREAKFSIP